MKLSCREVSALVSESLDRQLNLKERIGIHLHLMICRMCARYHRQIQFLSASARRVLQNPRSPFHARSSLSTEAQARIEAAIDGGQTPPEKGKDA